METEFSNIKDLGLTENDFTIFYKNKEKDVIPLETLLSLNEKSDSDWKMVQGFEFGGPSTTYVKQVVASNVTLNLVLAAHSEEYSSIFPARENKWQLGLIVNRTVRANYKQKDSKGVIAELFDTVKKDIAEHFWDEPPKYTRPLGTIEAAIETYLQD